MNEIDLVSCDQGDSMKFKSVLLLAVAIGCGLIAMLGVQQVLSGPKPEKQDEIQVLVATEDISPYTRLNETNTAFQTMSKEAIPEGAEPVTTPEEYLERVLRMGAVKGDLILKSKLTEKGALPSMEIPEGMRVVTVKVNQTQTHSGLIMPGDFVDVVLTYKTQEQGRGLVQNARTILQNVKIFAADNIRRGTVKSGDATEINAKNISFVVTPDEANLLMLAESRGQLTMALRHHGDATVVETKQFDDRVFDRGRILAGGVPSETEPVAAPADGPNGKDFKKFLEGRSATPAGTDNPKWKLTIFEGNQPREIEIELPKEPTEPTVPTEKLDSASAGAGGANPLKNWFLQTFVPSA